MSQLRGGKELRRRLKAIKGVFKPVGRGWADETVRLAKRRVKVRTGATQKSIRRRNASQKKAAVVASRGARFLEKGTQAHVIKPRKMRAMKFDGRGGTVFSKKVQHPRTSPQPFLYESAGDALRKYPMLDELIELWNKAA